MPLHLMFEQVVHDPLAVLDAAFRNWVPKQLGWPLHLKPLVVPEQAPLRYLEVMAPQSALVHVLHVPLAVFDTPTRYFPPLHLGWLLHR